MDWQACLPVPLSWISFREAILAVVVTPAFLLPLLAAGAWGLTRLFQVSRLRSVVSVALLPLAASLMYSPVSTAVFSAWLRQQVPASPPAPLVSPVVVLVGRGASIAVATTAAAAAMLRQGQAVAVYVSGDDFSTAERLVRLGVPADRVAGDSCVRTTWENAKRTATWMREHHPGADVLLITDPWQLARAARAFQRQGLRVASLAAEPLLSPSERNSLAIREAFATSLYRLQGRF